MDGRFLAVWTTHHPIPEAAHDPVISTTEGLSLDVCRLAHEPRRDASRARAARRPAMVAIAIGRSSREIIATEGREGGEGRAFVWHRLSPFERSAGAPAARHMTTGLRSVL